MGIPSYFSYIVKNYPQIIKKFSNEKKELNIDNLYLDCNSIIYDLFHLMMKEKSFDSCHLIKAVCSKIDSYINIIKPQKRVFIAFDGVAPVAKLEQQRARRYKTAYQNEIQKNIFNKEKVDPNVIWNTASITPGTKFMNDLSTYIKSYYHNPTSYHLKEIIISTSELFGEGEHKIFEFMRLNKDEHKNDTTIIYGLDADLIMLSINHLHICNNIYLFRETPHFIQSIDKTLEPLQNYLLDIPLLTKSILVFMNNNEKTYLELELEYFNHNSIHDYIFLSFLLGNDFLPHFPALNIRTGGMDKLLNAYKATIKKNEFLTNGCKIQWKNVRKLIEWLAKKEEEYILEEYKLRNKREKFHYNTDTPENIYKKFEALPTYEREMEKYIDPFKEHWQSRYYKILLDIKSDLTGDRRKQISINYLEGLEWTMKYYTSHCPDWRWCYQYHYPPLLTDLLKYIPVFETNFLQEQKVNPVSPMVQLAYVLPLNSLNLLPEKLHVKLMECRPEWYKNTCEIIWCFCTYFWESHIKLEEINIEELENIIESFLTNNKIKE